MKTYIINKTEKLPIKINYLNLKKNSNSLILFIGGSGDTKDDFNPLIEELQERINNYNFASFSFKGIEENKIFPLSNQTNDLKEVLKFFINKNINKFILIATSAGAYSTCEILGSNEFNKLIKKVILIDPADYYVEEAKKLKIYNTWSGSDEFKPTNRLVSCELFSIKGNFKIDVIHLTLKNYGNHDYIEKDFSKRGKSFPNAFPRLNTMMVKNFYETIPEKNKGKYLEIDNIPHGIFRDGKINQNILKVVNMLQEILIAYSLQLPANS